MFLTHRFSPGLLSITCFMFLSSGIFAKSNENVSRNHPSLLKTYSKKGLVETAKDHQWSINFNKGNKTDTLNIIAIRVEFNGGKKDSSTQITGNGLFGIRGGGDKTELNYYNTDTVYKYDQLPHDSTYFARQLDAVKKYYSKVSRGKLVLEYTIFPSGFSEKGYAVDSLMRHYSPGGKKKNESYNDYYFRQSSGLLRFIKEALEAAEKDPVLSPFSNLTYNESDKTIRDERNRKTVFLIFHAGSSSLTDGIANGYANTPSDMIDAFIDSDFFKFYRDTLKLSNNGVTVQGKNRLLIDEVMMCSETSNQDGVNWGIQGILVNQIARQLGIPDLYSNTSGNSGIGAFCIMDFSGYSAGNGFIPTYPSAWVRAFMGWDNVRVAPIGANNKYNIKALTTVLNNNNFNDTSILLVPINSNEYYLIENRQRNLSGQKDIFKYDTTEDKKYLSIAHYPFNVNVDKNVVSTSSESNVIQEVLNNDVSLPASGVLVWHVDEKIIREKLQHNMVNTDSSYRGVSLVEADGAFDIGVEFVDALSQTVFDYGSPEDVFPHKKEIFEKNITTSVSGFTPFSKPSSRSNDGGHSYLSLEITPHSANPLIEKMILNRADTLSHITNFSDTAFSVSVEWDYLARSWPKRTAPEQFFEPLLCDFDKSNIGNELVLLTKSGRLYAWSPDTTSENPYNKRQCVINRINLRGDTVYNADTVHILDSLANPASMPSAINGRIFIPSRNNQIYVLSSLTTGQLPYRDSISLPTAPSTNVCNYSDSSWAVGTVDGMIYSGLYNSHEISGIKLDSAAEVCAIAAIREDGGIVVAQSNGLISICNLQSKSVIRSKKINGAGPYTLITGDLDANDTSEIIVCDSKHGLWALDKNLNILPGWNFEEPNDWPSVYTYTENENTEDRSPYPVNLSAPSLADIDRDGKLDILVGGTNGIYAFNHKGVLLYGWPAYLDTKYWLQRGSITSSPIVVSSSKSHEPLVLFSSNTGEKLTYEIDKIVRADRAKGKIWYYNQKGVLDSMWDFTPMQIDTLLDQNDSLIMPYTMPGGFIDAITPKAKRPYETIQYKTGEFPYQSHWPLTTGGTLATSPLAGFMDNNKQPDLFAVSSDGWVYRWKLPQNVMADTLFWPMCGFDIGRTFAYAGKAPNGINTDNEPIRFFSYPNPTYGAKKAVFRYKFSEPAQNVKLDIYSQTGFKVYSTNKMGHPPTALSGSEGWNEHLVPVNKLGPSVYRCRMEATINGKKHVKYWKMAVIN